MKLKKNCLFDSKPVDRVNQQPQLNTGHSKRFFFSPANRTGAFKTFVTGIDGRHLSTLYLSTVLKYIKCT